MTRGSFRPRRPGRNDPWLAGYLPREHDTLPLANGAPLGASGSGRTESETVAPPLPDLRDRHDVVKRLLGRIEEAADVAGGLPNALFVFDQRQTHVVVPALAEADARRDRDIRLFDEQLGELEAAERPVGLGDLRPGEHRGAGAGDGPARLREAVYHDVAAALVGRAHLLDAIFRPVQGCGRSYLNRREGPVVQIGLHPRERGQEPLVADREADAPAGHREG